MRRVNDIMEEEDLRRLHVIMEDAKAKVFALNQRDPDGYKEVACMVATQVMKLEDDLAWITKDRDKGREWLSDAQDVIKEGRTNQMHYLEGVMDELNDKTCEIHGLRERLKEFAQ